MAKIIPHLWFDDKALEAADFYTQVFPNSRKLEGATLHDTPSGTVNIANIELMGLAFQMINAGPYFQPNPAISFMVHCTTPAQVDELWAKLIEGGQALMPLDSYPFSERFGWLNDRYGFSWQLILTPEIAPSISPTLMFVGSKAGSAEEAIETYSRLFPPAKVESIERYQEHEEPDRPGTVKHARFTLSGQRFTAMDSAHAHQFDFNEAVSLMVHCSDQSEIDRYWNALSAVPEAEQCGWLKDTFGVSWQIVPAALDTMMTEGDGEAIARVTQAFLKMKKFDLDTLEKAYRG